MASTRIFLRKNDTSQNEKLPYFTLVLPPEEDDGEWKEIGALWKAKSGNGYSGSLSDGVKVSFGEEYVNRAKKGSAGD